MGRTGCVGGLGFCFILVSSRCRFVSVTLFGIPVGVITNVLSQINGLNHLIMIKSGDPDNIRNSLFINWQLLNLALSGLN